MSSIHIKKSHKGLLHKNLGVAKGKSIPTSKLKIKSTDSPAVKKRKQFAINAKKFHHADDGITLDRVKGITNDDGSPTLMSVNDQVNPSLYNSISPINYPSFTPGKKTDWGKNILLGLTALDTILPTQPIRNPKITPQTTYNEFPLGTGSQAAYDDGGKVKKSYNPNLANSDSAFQQWYLNNTIEGKSNMPYSDKGDYDYYSYFRNGDYKNYQGGHFPDTYKRPNHQTFSNESIYSTPENRGGSWNGDKYVPNKMDDGGIVDDDPKKKGRKVNTVPTGYQPYPELGPNYYHSPSQSVGQTAGPKMSDAAWKKYVATHPQKTQSQTDDVVYIEPTSPAPIINPAYMSRGENIFGADNHARGLMYYDIPQNSNAPQQSGSANFAYYKPNTSEIDPSKTYKVPADEWNKIASTNHFQDEKALEQYKVNNPTAQYVDGGTLSASTAKSMLKNKTAWGHKLSGKQRAYFNKVAKKLDDGGNIEPLSNNPYSNGPIQEIGGKLHEDGGTPMMVNGQAIEAEKGETIHQDEVGNAVIGGNMQAPGTRKKFKSVFKDIAKHEEKATKILTKAEELTKEKDETDPYESLSINAAKLMNMGSNMKLKTLNDQKEHMSLLQQAMLDTAIEHNIDPQEMSKRNIKKLKASDSKAMYGMTIKSYKNGGTLKMYDDGGTVEERVKYLKELADKYGVDFKTMRNLVNQESGFNPSASSKAGARGIMQFIPNTAKQYGVQNILNSTNPDDIKRVMEAGVKHFKSLLDSNNNDYKLALAAYNGGQGSIDFAKKQLGKNNITGDDLMNFYEQRRKDHPTNKPNAWQNQTYDYINTISSGENIGGFRKKYNYQVPNDSFVTFPTTSAFDTTNVKPIVNDTLSINSISNFDNTVPISGNTNNGDGHITQPFVIPQDKKLPTNQEPLDFNQILPELYTAATNNVQPVYAQQYNPQLKQPYQVSFQDRLNENNSSFNAVKQLTDYNPTALSTLAGQKYQADSTVLADEFRTNDAQNRGIYNDNINTLNDAQLKNLSIADTQYQRQDSARSKTRAIDQSVLSSIASKYQQQKLDNRTLMANESMSGYRFVDKDGDGQPDTIQWVGGEAPFNSDNSVTNGTKTGIPGYGTTNLTSIKQEEDQNGLPGKKTINTRQVLKPIKKDGGSIPSLYNKIYGKYR